LNIDLFKEFFQAFANECGANVHINLKYGDEPHHIIESIFKAFTRALDMAVTIDPRFKDGLFSTKGLI
jgi:imidazoleglycerol-phosphate dehydratase